jgi:hypothetical protein
MHKSKINSSEYPKMNNGKKFKKKIKNYIIIFVLLF